MVEVNISYTTPMPVIAYDRAGQILESDPLAIVFSGIYDNSDFGVDVTFNVPNNTQTGETYNITSINVTLPSSAEGYSDGGGIEAIDFPDMLNYTLVDNTVSISGRISGLLKEYYTFVMRDQTVKNLLINNSEDWIAVVKWEVPPIKEIGISYEFTVVYQDSLFEEYVENITIPQWIYWRWQESLAAMKAFVAAGEI